MQALLRNGKPLQDFVLPFGDRPALKLVEPPQSLEYLERRIDSWISGSNAMFREGSKKSS